MIKSVIIFVNIVLLVLLLSCNNNVSESTSNIKTNSDNTFDVIHSETINSQKYELIENFDMNISPLKKTWYINSNIPFCIFTYKNGVLINHSYNYDIVDTSLLVIPDIKIIKLNNDSLFDIKMTSIFYPIQYIDYGTNLKNHFDNNVYELNTRHIRFNKKDIVNSEFVILSFGFKTPAGNYIKMVDSVKIELPK